MRYALIMRGLPGSGKSSFVSLFKDAQTKAGKTVAVHSTDDLCTINGKYCYDPELAGERHAENLKNFVKSLEAGTDVVIVDNTNVKIEHFEKYTRAAEKHGYAVVFVEMAHSSTDVAAARNLHNVPISVINKMYMEWESAQPLVIVADLERAIDNFVHLKSSKLNLFYAGICIGFALNALLSCFLLT